MLHFTDFGSFGYIFSQVEDHYPEGGIGDAVLDAVADIRNVVVKKLAVNAVPRSGNFLKFTTCLNLSFRSPNGTVGDVWNFCQLHFQGCHRIDITLGSQFTPENQY